MGDKRVFFYCSFRPGTLAHELLPIHFEKAVVSGQPAPSASKKEGLGSDNWLWVNSRLFCNSRDVFTFHLMKGSDVLDKT